MRIRHNKSAAVIAALAALALSLSACTSASPEPTVDEEVTLDFTWWGNDSRAEMMNEAIALFQDDNPNITIKGSFSDFPSYWEKRTVEAAARNLPDLMLFSDQRLLEFGDRGLLLDLAQYPDQLDVSGIDATLLPTGMLGDALFATPTGSNVWAMWLNEAVVGAAGDPPAEMTWDEYNEWVVSFDPATGVKGGLDWSSFWYEFELVLRQDGKFLISSDGELGFTEADLNAHWSANQALRDQGAFVAAPQFEEVFPLNPIGASITATQMSWSNSGGTFSSDLGTSDGLKLIAPPTDNPKVKDLYLRPSTQLAVAANTDHPEAAALFLNFMANDPRVGAIFGASMGFPASAVQRDAAEFSEIDQAAIAYTESVQNRIGDPPPIPAAGYGSLQGKFNALGLEILGGTKSVDDAVSEFFLEADVILNP